MRWALIFGLVLIFAGSFGVADAKAGTKDEAEIRRLVADFSTAWNRSDAKAMAAMWIEDGDFIQPAGRITRGRADIEKRLAEEHSFFYTGSRFTSTVDTVRFLKLDVAVVDGAWETSGAHTPKGKPLPTMKGLYTLIVVKRSSKWWVVSSRSMVPAKPPD